MPRKVETQLGPITYTQTRFGLLAEGLDQDFISTVRSLAQKHGLRFGN